MKPAKRWLFAILVSFLFGFQIVHAFDLLNFDFQSDENYLEFSEVDAKKIIGSISRELRNKWIEDFSKNSSPQETTALSFLRDATVFDFWNYTLADLPANTVINTLKIVIKDFSSEEAVAKRIIERIEKLSVNEAVRVATEELFANQAKVAFGAIRGMNSKDNKETIFQYVIVYKPLAKDKGLMTIRFFSPKKILPPQTKTSYGLSLGFVNMLEEGEELPPFTLEIRGEVEDFLSGSYRFTSIVETNIAFSENTPDLALVPISWTDRYVVDPMNKFLKDIPFIGGLFGSTNNSEILKGSGGDSGEIKEEVMNIIRGVSIENEGNKDEKKETVKSEKKEDKSTSEEKLKKEKEKADKKLEKEEQEKQKKKEK